MKIANIKRLRCNRRALSPIFATLILTAIVVTFGSVAYYYASNSTTTATNEFTSQIANSRQAISERILVERVEFRSGATPYIFVYMLNCGSANNVQINAILLTTYDINFKPHTDLFNIDSNSVTSDDSTFIHLNGNPIKSLNIGDEGYISVPVNSGISLANGYSIQIITKSGSSFDYAQ